LLKTGGRLVKDKLWEGKGKNNQAQETRNKGAANAGQHDQSASISPQLAMAHDIRWTSVALLVYFGKSRANEHVCVIGK